jgi:ligand-binding sensor domain-containing protein
MNYWRINLSAFLLLFTCSYFVKAQEYSYVHHDVQNGLAGANVYALYQDPQKFLWFGTETGVSRFDGTHFKNFTTNDGLPDNEILEIYGDDEGRVWLVPFKKTICYYYQGKIYNQQNDSILAKIKLQSNVLTVCKDKYKNTWILEEKGLYLITAKNELRFFDKINNVPLDGPLFIGLNKQQELILQWQEGVYTYNNQNFQWLFNINIPIEYRRFLSVHIAGDFIVWRSGEKNACAQSFTTKEMHCFEFPVNTMRFSTPGNGTIAINTTGGTIIYNPVTKKSDYNFLNNLAVSKVLIDHEGSWWFSTLGEGVYQLLSTSYKNFVPWKEGSNQEIFSLSRLGNKLIMGTNFSQLLYTTNFKTTGSIILPTTIKNKYNRVMILYKTPGNKLIVGTDEILGIADENLNLTQSVKTNAIKNIFYKNDDSVYIATANEMNRISLNNLSVSEKLWGERSTAVSVYKNTVFVGTLNGLYHLPTGKLPVFMGEYDSLFTKRVSSMVISSDTTLWVGTYDGGIIGLKKGQVTDTINTERGLTSNICRHLFIEKDIIWAGTDKGLTRIDVKTRPFKITSFTVNDGLLSNHINAVYKEGDTVYVATQDGITYFNEKIITNTSQCSLVITNVFHSSKDITVKNDYHFDHDENNFRIEFVGISYKSAGDIIYKYKLEGLDTDWKTTKGTSLDFLSLPAGDYVLNIIAINKFGIKSQIKRIAISIEKAFYQTTWFYTLAIAATAALTWFLVALYNQRRRKKEKHERETQKRITELEQMALRAQMNPHFIFNCLNSIQQFVYDKDIQQANKFISGFARLIRQTLDNSAKTTITVANEVDYLGSYLALEKIRFENQFDYKITVDAGINTEEYKIPVMLIQPHVENSIRHGIRYKKEGGGKISIQFSLQQNHLVCVIEDNGIGRKKALELKSRQHIEYQSKGMLLTTERIEAMNKVLNENIKMEVVDMEDENQESLGTKILIYFPLGFVQNN